MNHVWQFLHRAGHGIGRGLSISLIKTWQFSCWVVPKIGQGIWFSLTKTWQFIYWAVPRICRGLWFFLSTTWMVFWLIVSELLILLFKMVNGPKRALTVFVSLVVLLHLWEYMWGGVRYPALILLTENPTFAYLRVAGILAGLVNLLLFYEWVKSRLSPKANLPVPVGRQQDRHFEQSKAILRFPSKRVYSDIEKAQAIVAMDESGSVPHVSQQLDIPPSTLHSWKNKYQMDSRFQFRINQVIWLVTRVKMGRYDRQDQIETDLHN